MPTEQLVTQESVDVSKLDTAMPLDVVFQPFQSTLDKWKSQVASLTVTRLDQVAEMKQARAARLELKDARVTMDKTRKGLVEGLKARTGKIDETARLIRVEMERMEAALLESEQFAERHAAQLREELIQKRTVELQPYVTGPILINLAVLSDAEFEASLSDAKAAHQARLDAAAQVERERIAKQEAQEKERQRLEAENAELQRQAMESARVARVERLRVDALEKEKREAQQQADRLQREAVARQQAEADARAKAEREEKERCEAARIAAANAPDKERLAEIASTLRGIPTEALRHTGYKAELKVRIASLATWIDGVVSDL